MDDGVDNESETESIKAERLGAAIVLTPAA